MPCRTDHMEPTAAEIHRRQAAQNLVYVYRKLGQPVPVDLSSAAASLYGGGDGDRWVERLCILCRGMSDEQKDRIIYDGRDRASRALADWYEDHIKEDEESEIWDTLVHAAKEAPSNFNKVYAYVAWLDEHDHSLDVIANNVSNLTNQYYDEEDSTHVFTFPTGIIILSAMDGVVAYSGERK